MSSGNSLSAIDVETHPIRTRPDYPPESVGYAVKHGRRKEYLAFGHPSGNNCTKRQALKRVCEVLRSSTPVFHNADFDLEVMAADGVEYDGDYHDTMRLAFLNEPRSTDLGLKPQAEQWLGEPPEERDFLKDWILDNIREAKKRPSRWGEYIYAAPGGLVGEYAKGDVERTLNLYKYFDEEIRAGGMAEAYEREMDLVPIKMEMENFGIRVRVGKLKKEIGAYYEVRDQMEKAICKKLGKKINVGSPKQLADALIEKDLLSAITRTKPSKNFPDGQISTQRAVLEQNCTDKKLVEMLAIHSTLENYLSTFLQRWLDVAEVNEGYIQPNFNTVRSSDEFGGGRTKGTRTGRLSSSDPNFQNVPNNVESSPHAKILLKLREFLRKQGVEFVGLRDYFAPDEGCVFLRRDYDQQELRILAHFEQGPFLRMYDDNPDMDAHDAVRALVLEATGLDFPRKHIKQTNFGIVYGMGIAKLARRLELNTEEARTLKNAVMKAIPGVKVLMRELKKKARRDEPFYTWGGREYYCEEPMLVATEDGGKQKRTFEYKMLNTLVQGSAADCTKQGMVNTWHNSRHGRIVLQVHDEILMSVPKNRAKEEMRRMKEAMEDVHFRVPMKSEGETGARSWARMRKTA